jgi:cytoskeletal protein CcmA (bactofilin family)
MGFFKKSVSCEVKSTALTIIAKGNKIAGEMVITGKLHIDGTVEGSITSIENVSIGKTGIISGKLKAKNVTVNGLLEGEVECDHLHITAGGKVKANVCSIDLTMEAKSHFFGESREKAPLLAEVNKAAIFDNSVNQLQSADSLLDNLPNTVTSFEQTGDANTQATVLKDDQCDENVTTQSPIKDSVADTAKNSETSYEPETSYCINSDSQLTDLSFNHIVNQDFRFINDAELAASTSADNSQDEVATDFELDNAVDIKPSAEPNVEPGAKLESEIASTLTEKLDQKLDDSEQLAAVDTVNTVAEVKPKKRSRAKTVDKNTTVMELKI